MPSMEQVPEPTNVDITDDIALWLRVWLDEDERVALAAKGHSLFDGTGIYNFRNDSVGRNETVVIPSHLATHISCHDPVRVLREVKAKRGILDEHHRTEQRGLWQESKQAYDTDVVCAMCVYTGDDEDSGGNRWRYREHAEWPCLTVALLALPYSDRPGYQESWRP